MTALRSSAAIWPLAAEWNDGGDDLFCVFAIGFAGEPDVRLNIIDDAGEYLLHVHIRPGERLCRVGRTLGRAWMPAIEFPLHAFAAPGPYAAHVRMGARQWKVAITSRAAAAPVVTGRFAVPAPKDAVPWRVEASDNAVLETACFTRVPCLPAPPRPGRARTRIVAALTGSGGGTDPAFGAGFDRVVRLGAGESPWAACAAARADGVVLWPEGFRPDPAGIARLRAQAACLPSDGPWAILFPLAARARALPGLLLLRAGDIPLRRVGALAWVDAEQIGADRIMVLDGPPVGTLGSAAAAADSADGGDAVALAAPAADWATLRGLLHADLARRSVTAPPVAGERGIRLHAWPTHDLRLVLPAGPGGDAARLAKLSAHAGHAALAETLTDWAVLPALLRRAAPRDPDGVLACVLDEPGGAALMLLADSDGLARLPRLPADAASPGALHAALCAGADAVIGPVACYLRGAGAADPLLHRIIAALPPHAGAPAGHVLRGGDAVPWSAATLRALHQRAQTLHDLAPAPAPPRAGPGATAAARLMRACRTAAATIAPELLVRHALRARARDAAGFARDLPALLVALTDADRPATVTRLLDALTGPDAAAGQVAPVIEALVSLRLFPDALRILDRHRVQPALRPETARALCLAAFERGDRHAEAAMLHHRTATADDAARAQQAHLHFRHGDWAEAATRFERLLRATPRDWHAHSCLVQCCIRLGDADQARARLETLRAIAPGFIDVPKLEGMLGAAAHWDDAARARNAAAIIRADPALEPVSRRDWALTVTRPFETPPGPDAIVAFLVARNEALRLPSVLDAHRALGVTHVVLIDNGSTDGTARIAAARADVCVVQAAGSYRESRCAVGWFNTLMDRFGHDRWCLCLDADEVLAYPGSETVPLPDLCRYLDAQGAEGMMAFMLDMYADTPLRATRFASGDDLGAVFRFYDPAHYARWPLAATPATGITGGVRERVFRVGRFAGARAMALQKLPLVKWRIGMQYLASTHDVTPLRVAEVTGVLLHYKYLPDFHARAAEEVARREHWNDASEYRMYAHKLSGNPDFSLYHEGAARYQGTAQLVAQGLIDDPASFRQWRHRHAGPRLAVAS